MRPATRQIGLLLLGCAGTLMEARATEPLVIRNDTLEVRCDAESGSFTIVEAEAVKPFATGRLLLGGGRGRVGTLEAQGADSAPAARFIEVTRKDGGIEVISLHPGEPFARFRSTLQNTAGEATVTNQVETIEVTLDLGKPASALKALGTGGLSTIDKNPGSYMWMAVADPVSRRGAVAGWLTANRGSGIVFTEVIDDAPRLRTRLDHGRLRIEPGESTSLETLAIGRFDDARLGLEAWADGVAKAQGVHLPAQPVGYCTWYHSGASNANELARQAEFAAKSLKPHGFSFVQIDDGWQAGQAKNGPRKNFTTHRADGPYPEGMRSTAERIAALGLTPGLWFMPFAGTFDDPFFADKQAWFVKHADGTPYDTDWGGTCLDMTHPDARAYLAANAKRIAHEWGYRYFKMDGLWTGTGTKQIYVNSGYRDDGMGDAVFHDPGKTNIEAYRLGLRTVREAAGTDVFLLGCCAPQNMRSYGAAFGLVDAMRIGPDNGAAWPGLLAGPTFGSRNYHLHGRVWYNDPDPLYVRPELSLELARLVSSWVTVSGQLSVSSDDFSRLTPERLDLLRRTMPSHGKLARPVDLFDHDPPRAWVVYDGDAPRLLGLFNWDTAPITIDEPLDRLGLESGREYAAFDFWNDALAPPLRERLKWDLGAPAAGKGQDKEPSGSFRAPLLRGAVDPAGDRPSPSDQHLASYHAGAR